MKNKKGSFIFWMEMIIFLGLFLFIVAVIGADMNATHGKSHDLTFGLNLSGTLSDIDGYQETLINATSEGQTSLTDYGILKLTSVPGILLTATRILWSFVSGSFIYALVMNMQLGAYGQYIAIMFQTIYVIAIAYMLIKLVLKI